MLPNTNLFTDVNCFT